MASGDFDYARHEVPRAWAERHAALWTCEALLSGRYYTVDGLERSLCETWRKYVDSGNAETAGWRLKWHGWVWAPNEPMAVAQQ